MVASRNLTHLDYHEPPQIKILSLNNAKPGVVVVSLSSQRPSLGNCNLDTIPDIDELPLLDDESIFEGSTRTSTFTRKFLAPKPRRSRMVSFTDSSNDHPLNTVENTVSRVEKTDLERNRDTSIFNQVPFYTFFLSLYQKATLNNNDEILKLHKKDCATEEFPRGVTELVEFRRSHIPLHNPSIRRLHRANSEFLRMFVAEKSMIDSGKLTRITCDPFKAPKVDYTRTNQELLGISYRWKRYPQKRHWVQLN